MQWKATNYFQQQILTGAVAHAVSTFSGVLDGAKVALFTGAPVLNGTTVFADLTEASFDGYARSAGLTWQTPIVNAAGQAEVAAPAVTFAATDGTVPQVVTGVVIFSGNSPNEKVLLAGMLDTPFNVSAAGQGLIVLPLVELNPEDWGAPIVAQ